MNTQLALLGKHINMAPRVHRRWLVVATYAAFSALIVAVFWFSKSLFYAWCLIAVVAVSLMVSHLVGRPTDAVDERAQLPGQPGLLQGGDRLDRD